MALQIKDGQVVYVELPAELSEATKQRLKDNPLAAESIRRARALPRLRTRVDTGKNR